MVELVAELYKRGMSCITKDSACCQRLHRSSGTQTGGHTDRRQQQQIVKQALTRQR